MPTSKILLQLIQLKKKLFLQTTVYKYFRLQKHLVNNNNNNLAYDIMDEHILLITMLTIKSLSTIDSLKKKLFRQDNIYNSFRLKEKNT